MFSNQRKKKPGVHFEIIPMIDVMMILVLFLAVMAFLPQIQSAISTRLPSSASSDEVSVDDVLVSINQEGMFVGSEAKADLPGIIAGVQAAQEGDIERRVVIAADANLQYESVAQLLSALQEVGIRNVALATEANN